MNIGNKIKELRIKAEMTQEELAQKIGYKSRSSINKIELGERKVSDKGTILLLSQALGTTPNELLGWDRELDDLDYAVLKIDPDFNPKKGFVLDYSDIDAIEKYCKINFADDADEVKEIIFSLEDLTLEGRKKVSERINELRRLPGYSNIKKI